MNTDNIIHCDGVDMADKSDWNGKYPYFEPTRLGFIVHVSKKANLAGVFTSRSRAEMAFARYRGTIVEADARMKEKKANKKEK